MSNGTTEVTARIPVDNLPTLREKIAKLNKVATKLGLPEISLVVGEPEVRPNSGLEMMTGPHASAPQVFQEVVPVTVEGEAPRLNGWEFIATLEHDENGTLIRRIPTFAPEVDLSQYRTATPDNCDHCGYKRRRNDTYIVVGETGETKQVGSNCLKDFTGHESPQQIARFLEQVRDLIEAVAGGGYSEGRLVPRYSLDELMATAVKVVREEGYVSRRIAEETGADPTAQVVKAQFFDRVEGKRPYGDELDPTDQDHLTGVAVINWVQNLTEAELDNDYLYNLFTVCKSGTLTERQMGIAASAVTAYERANRQQAERQVAPIYADEFLGDEGGRIDVEFRITHIFEEDGDYGHQFKYIMATTTGHKLTWRTGAYELEKGKDYRANFFVRKHWSGKNGKETQVNRPRKGDPQEVV